MSEPDATPTERNGDAIDRSDAGQRYYVYGLTSQGRTFRPSDWAERLCGVLSCYRPGGGSGRDAHLGYSPYARPISVGVLKCVIVDERLKDIEPLAFRFALDFAKDNDLTVSFGVALPETALQAFEQTQRAGRAAGRSGPLAGPLAGTLANDEPRPPERASQTAV